MKVLVPETRHQTCQSSRIRWSVCFFHPLPKEFVHLLPQKAIPYQFNLFKNTIVDDALLEGSLEQLFEGILLSCIAGEPHDFLDADNHNI